VKRAPLALLLVLAACGGQPPLPPPPPAPPPIIPPPAPVASEAPRQTPDAPFRENPPEAHGSVTWSPPKIATWSLHDGVHVLLVERHDLPIVSVRVVTSAGAGDVGLRPASVAFMGSLLEQGAGARTALQISDDLQSLGVAHGAGCDWDACSAQIKALTSRLGPALDILADVVLRPTFPDAEIERSRQRWLGSIQQEKSSPGALEQNALAAAVFGRAHPYGHSLRGVPSDVEKLARRDLEQAYARLFAPASTSILVAGDVTEADLRSMLEARFGGWKGAAAPRIPVPAAPASGKGGGKVVLVDAPGAAQSQVFVAAEGAPFASPDRVPLAVMNLILGGMFSSRINLDLREDKAYTYGARSRFQARHGAGPFLAGGAMFGDDTAAAARELVAQVESIRSEPVTAGELADAKENARLALPSRFEGVDEVTGALQDLVVYGLPLDEYDVRAARIDAVTAADVQRVARRWLHPEALRIVVTGDRGRVEKDLSALGRVEIRDAYGDLVH
jgi:predicted Zn-dependent peptidase